MSGNPEPRPKPYAHARPKAPNLEVKALKEFGSALKACGTKLAPTGRLGFRDIRGLGPTGSWLTCIFCQKCGQRLWVTLRPARLLKPKLDTPVKIRSQEWFCHAVLSCLGEVGKTQRKRSCSMSSCFDVAILEDGLEHFTLFPVAPGCQGQFGCAVVVRTTQRGSQTCEKHARTRSE